MKLDEALFIGGCDRSGTTLLGSLLARSPRVHTTPESQFKIQAIIDAGGIPSGFDPMALFRDTIEQLPRWALWAGAAPSDLKDPSYGELLLDLASSHARASGAPDSARIWVDHTPHNLRFARLLDEALPRARFIHVVRDGRAVSASLIPLAWGPRTPLDAADFWKGRIAEGLAVELAPGFEGRVLRVLYEDLVREPERTLVKVCHFAGIDFEPKMLEGGALRVPDFTAAQHQLVNSPPDPSRIDAWRDKLSPEDLSAFEWSAGSLLDALGYRCEAWPAIARIPRGLRLRYAWRSTGPRAVSAWFAQRRRVQRI